MYDVIITSYLGNVREPVNDSRHSLHIARYSEVGDAIVVHYLDSS